MTGKVVVDPAAFSDEFNRRLHEASGSVHDNRRIVTWLYLFIRDHVSTHVVGTALFEMSTSEWARGKREYTQETLDRANRLVDAPTDTLREFLQRIRWAVTDDVWMRLDGQVPLRDDTEVSFSNGWLASYCKYVIEITRHDVQQDQPNAS